LGHAEYHGVCRFEAITDNLVITATGEFADFQEATRQLKELSRESAIVDDGVSYSVDEYANYLAALSYERRNKQNPFYNNFVVAGFENGQAYLSSIDLYGTHIRKDWVAAGFSKYYGLALIANHWNPELPLEECKKLIHKAWTVLYERDCHTVDEIQFSVVTANGVEIQRPEKVSSDWDFKEFRERANEKLWQ
jgi:20S proteasome subunit beta 7